nr:fasciclin domain-containing protein [uncultured Pedobacter sp.]
MTKNFKQYCFIIVAMVFSVVACKKQAMVYTTDNTLNITGYLDSQPENFSEFSEILQITGNAGFLDAYGAYTLFAPNNAAVDAYLKDLGKTSVKDVDLATLKDLVRIHLIEDTISTTDFKDGKLRTLTMYGQYLTTIAKNIDGSTKVVINRQANLVQGNILVGNGLIHVIDHVLIPAQLSVYKLIKSQPEKYSFFTKALEASTLSDTLDILPANNGNRWFTVLAETDSTLMAAGYTSADDLITKLAKGGNPSDPANGLRKFVEYHILPGIKYLSDIASASSHVTLAPTEVITTKLVSTQVLVNDDDFNGNHETGISLNRSRSDYSATNGVLHTTAPYTVAGVTSTGDLAIKVRVPFRLYWELSDFPELRALPAYFRRASYTFGGTSAVLDQGTSILSGIYSVGGVRKTGLYYVYSSSEKAAFGDYIKVPLGAPNRVESFTFTTPLLVKGKYKVWACYRYYKKSSNNKACVIQASFDGIPMLRTFDTMAKRPSGDDVALESQGWKQYLNESTDNNYNGRLLGTIEFGSTKTYQMELKWVSGDSSDAYMDEIQFIPVDQDQIHPRINQDGTLEF